MKYSFLAILIGVFLFQGCKNTTKPIFPENYQSSTLKIERLNDNAFVHISYLESPTFGKVECNGLVFFDHGEAVVFDTPINDPVSRELIQWIEDSLKCMVKAVVINHFHEDCLGGLAAFHQKEVDSYAHAKTIELARLDSAEALPQHSFPDSLNLQIGHEIIQNRHWGAGHAPDNIISYMPSSGTLFGGCVVKAVGATKGNLSDADEVEWPKTIARIKSAYPNLNYVVPGHGKVGGVELLDYTIGLFTLDAASKY